VLYLGIIGWTLMTSRITLSQAGYNKVQINQVHESKFRISTQAGDKVGEMDCKLTPQGSNILLDCAGNVMAYEVSTSTGAIKEGNHSTSWSATWDTNTMGLLDFQYDRTYSETGSNLHAALKDGRLVVENSAGRQEITLSPSDLLEYEWAWRVNALKPQFFTSIQAPFAYMLWRDERAGNSHPALRSEVLHLYKSEPLDLPAGHFQAHRASLGGQSAWYTNDHAGPVRIDDGALIYELE
jgi:hypothetical protein